MEEQGLFCPLLMHNKFLLRTELEHQGSAIEQQEELEHRRVAR